MSTSRERHDEIRGEGEGFSIQEMDSEHFLFLFLGRVKRKFQEKLNTKHIEDVVPGVVSDMTASEKQLFELNIKDQLGSNMGKSINSHLKEFLGDEEWEKLEILERNRIMEHDRHESEGVG